MAHLNKKKGNIFISKGHLYDTNMNRSPTAYLENPEWERALYVYFPFPPPRHFRRVNK